MSKTRYFTHIQHTYVCTLLNDRWEEKYPEHSHPAEPKTDSRHIVSDDKPDCVMRSDTPSNMIMKSDQNPSRGETKTRSGLISYRPERLGSVT